MLHFLLDSMVKCDVSCLYRLFHHVKPSSQYIASIALQSEVIYFQWARCWHWNWK